MVVLNSTDLQVRNKTAQTMEFVSAQVAILDGETQVPSLLFFNYVYCYVSIYRLYFDISLCMGKVFTVFCCSRQGNKFVSCVLEFLYQFRNLLQLYTFCLLCIIIIQIQKKG